MSVEVQHKLFGDWLHHRARMPENKARAIASCAGLKQWIRHAGNRPHRADAGADTGRGEASGTKVTQLTKLHKVFKTIAFSDGDEACSLPRLKLARTDTENS